MTRMKAVEAERFYEEDEDPDEVFATFDAAAKGRTAPPGGERPTSRWPEKIRHEIAVALRRSAHQCSTRGEPHRVATHEGALGSAAACRHLSRRLPEPVPEPTASPASSTDRQA